MGSFTYLLGSENDGPPIRDEDILPTHDVSLRWMKRHIPLLWLALFRPEDMRWGTVYLSPEDMFWEPYLVSRKEACVALYQQRRPWLEQVFCHHSSAIASWEGIINEVDAPYLKLEFEELSVSTAGFVDEAVMDVCALFDGPEDADLTGLLRLAGDWAYDGANRALVWQANNAHWVAVERDLMGLPEGRPTIPHTPWEIALLVAMFIVIAMAFIGVWIGLGDFV